MAEDWTRSLTIRYFMGWRVLLAWRKSRTAVFATLFVLAVFAYAAELRQGYVAGWNSRPKADAARITGSNAQSFAGAVRRPRSRTVALNARRRKRAAVATWVFSEYATRALRTHLGSASPDLVVEGSALDAGAPPAEVAVRGCLTAPLPAKRTFRVVLHLPACPIDRTPVYSVSIRVRRSAWVISAVQLQKP
jgi:hypothetical protein